MAVGIHLQPTMNSLNAAYRPILITGAMSGAMPIVFCDIYFDGTYYKTITKTDQSSLFPVFDIQDAAQEYLGTFLAANGAPLVAETSRLFTQCICKLRGSSIDGNGFTIPDPVEPIQGSLGVPPQAGTGTATQPFWVLNATLQVEDNQNLQTHLTAFRTGTWLAEAFPLSHRPNRYRNDGSDYFPIFYHGVEVPRCVKIYWTKKDGTTGNNSVCDTSFPDCPVITGQAVTWENNGDGTQNFFPEWLTPAGALYIVDAQYRIAGSADPWTSNLFNASLLSGNIGPLPLGLYDFRFRVYSGLGGCNPTISAEIEDVGDVDVCVIPTITETTLPDGQELVAYNHSMAIVGSTPFSLSAITKPAWMTIAISGSNVVFSGTPGTGDAGANIAVNFTVDNACGSDSVAQLIDVELSPTGNPMEAVYGATEAATCINFPAMVYLPPPNVTLAVGITVFTDIIMTSPLTGQNFIRDNSGGNIFEINNLTGVVGADTGLFC